MANRVSITNLREYAERMAKPSDIRYRVLMTSKVREWVLKDLESRAEKVNMALSSDTIKEKTRLLRQEEAKDILAVYEAIEQAEIVNLNE